MLFWHIWVLDNISQATVEVLVPLLIAVATDTASRAIEFIASKLEKVREQMLEWALCSRDAYASDLSSLHVSSQKPEELLLHNIKHIFVHVVCNLSENGKKTSLYFLKVGYDGIIRY